jgi:hypothetical protein
MEHLLSNKERERTLLGYFRRKKLRGTKKLEGEKNEEREILVLQYFRGKIKSSATVAGVCCWCMRP